jgi:hypothetical protein
MPIETPSGTVDGSNATFTISTAPTGDILLYNNGVLQESSYNYTRAGTTLTFLSSYIPQTGDRLLAVYSEAAVLAASGTSGATTVAAIIRRALKILGVLAAEETPSAAEESDALITLNDMVDSWAGERLVLNATLRSTYTLTPSLSPHTIGSGGTFDTTRPARIDRASIIPAGSAGSETPLVILSDGEWQSIQGKTSTGTPIALWVETAYPLMKLHLESNPERSGHAGALHVAADWPLRLHGQRLRLAPRLRAGHLVQPSQGAGLRIWRDAFG